MSYHQEKHIRTAIHGDDFTLLGDATDLDWFRTQIAGKYSANSGQIRTKEGKREERQDTEQDHTMGGQRNHL